MYLPELLDNSQKIWPKQPYQPEYVTVNYKVTKRNSTLSVTCESISLTSARDMLEYYYKCVNGLNIKKGLYYDALKDCEKSNSSIQTYLNEVFRESQVLKIGRKCLNMKRLQDPPPISISAWKLFLERYITYYESHHGH